MILFLSFLGMAIAGLHNVSAFSPFFSEGRRDQPSTRASALLQIWREIEGEQVVNQSRQQRNALDSECLSTSTSFGRGSDNGDDVSQNSNESEHQGSELDHGESGSMESEQSSDLGETERERVRQIFRDWTNSSSKGPPSCGFNLNNCSGQWLGENECQRVRIIREWVQTTAAQQRNNCGPVRDGVAQFGSQLQQVRDGLAISHPEIGPRRHIRRLCGRQTLLDLLLRAQSERKSDLVALSGRRPVSDFAHRNRIQALLRGRFLRNESSVPHEKTSSNAATELSLLRQRHTVSDLREEFLSKLENSASTSVNIAKSDCSSTGENNEELISPSREWIGAGIGEVLDLASAACRNTCYHELQVQGTETEDTNLDIVGRPSNIEEPALDPEATNQEVFTDVDNDGRNEQINAVSNESLIETEGGRHSDEQNEVHSNAHEVVDVHSTALERDPDGEIDLQDSSSQVEEFQESGIDTRDGVWQQFNTVAPTDVTEESARGLEGGRTTNQWAPVTSHNNVEEQQDPMQDSQGDWPSQDFEEAIDSWLDMPSRTAGESFGRADSFYLPDHDNEHSMELRELFSRRRVSSLLRSGFRESLNQVLQSHVERLGHASDDWETENTPGRQQGQNQLNGDQNLSLSDGSERNRFAPASSFFTSQLLWDEELQTPNWSRQISNQQMGTVEWEVINELRLDMARLQLRMDNMQSMLETCMDMQIELQRAVRQEVSAALNRSTFSNGILSDANKSQIHDESRWDHVGKGVCCLCRDSKVDSLLYRCGHMCSCSKCAENLVQEKGNCPMCEAPVVEVVRAYFVQ